LPDGEKNLSSPQPASKPEIQPEIQKDRASSDQARATAGSHQASGIGTDANPVRSSELMLIGIAFSLFSFAIIGVLTHEIPYLVDMGISMTTAATLLGLTAGLGVGGKMGLGYVADRLSPKKVLLGCIALQIAGVVILMQAGGLAMIWGFVVIFSFAMGATNTLRPLVIGEIFGMNAFGRNLGMIELMRRLGAAVGPFTAGYIFDVTQSYRYAFIAFIAAYLAGMLALFWVRPNPRPLHL
jgi:MFS family permease